MGRLLGALGKDVAALEKRVAARAYACAATLVRAQCGRTALRCALVNPVCTPPCPPALQMPFSPADYEVALQGMGLNDGQPRASSSRGVGGVPARGAVVTRRAVRPDGAPYSR